MADFAIVWESRHEVIEECQQLLNDCNASKSKEYNAVIKIQQNFRGLIARTLYKSQRHGAIMKQRLFRGHTGRKRVQVLLKELRAATTMAFFHYHATVMQRTMRGFYSRKYIHDFFARKAYIQNVVEKSNLLREQLALQREISKKEEQERKLRDAQEEFKTATTSLHHLVSTKSRLGIYRSPFSHELEPKAFGMSVEDHLRQNTKEILRTRGLRTVRKPRRRHKLSVQAQAPYDAVIEAERAESRYSKMRRLSRANFIAGSKERSIEGKHTSLFIGTKYIEAWRVTGAARGNTTILNAEGQPKVPFHRMARTGKLFDEISDWKYEEQVKRRREKVRRGMNVINGDRDTNASAAGTWERT